MTKQGAEFNVDELVKKRGVIKGKLTLYQKYVGSLDISSITEMTKIELQSRFQNLQTLLDQFTSIQDTLEIKSSESQLVKELVERESFENQYYAVVAKSKCILKDTDYSVQSSSQSQGKSHSMGHIKFPTIPLPTFDGSYDQWLEFRDTFTSLIHSCKDIDNTLKFHYLRSTLTGNALQVIKSLEFSSENYVTAWELLEVRFNNSRLLVHNHVKALFSAPSVSKESPMQIRKLIDSILRNLRALKTLGEPTESWDTLLIYIVTSKLDASTEKEWELHKSNILNIQSSNNCKLLLSDLVKFLKDRADVLETIKLSQNKQASESSSQVIKPHSSNQKPFKPQSHSYISNVNTDTQNKRKSFSSSSSKRFACIMCKANHPIYSCEQFLNLTPKDKLQYIDSKNLCRNCLRCGHTLSECWYGPCKLCSRKHNSLIHSELADSRATVGVPSSSSAIVAHTTAHASYDVGTVDHTPNITTSSHTSTQTLMSQTHTHYSNDNTHTFLEQVLLSTALVEIVDNDNNYHTIRALLDNGSQHCFISEALCTKINIPLIQSTVHITGVGNSITQSTQSCTVLLRSKASSYITHISCLVLPRITAQLPSLGSHHNIYIPENIHLADPQFYSPDSIDLLIGADKFWELLDDGLIRLAKGPYLQNTKLGWIISGAVHIKENKYHQVQCNFTQTCLDTQIKMFWELEEIPSCKVLSKEEIKCENMFIESTTRDISGRFCVRIPLKESPQVLGDSITSAENRFYALERKLNKSSPDYKIMYCDFMHEYIKLGHMTRIDNYPPIHYFLPHHGVFRESSTTTKLRVVFDASAKSSSNKSLNDIQMIGPSLQNDIFSILLRFRRYRYVACADVEKMYRQILIQPDQRALQLVLWRENTHDPLHIYQLNTVTYGTSSAPYLSIRCIRQLASECKDDVIAQVISDDFYVDDLITGHDDIHQLKIICHKVSNILKSACFPLRKWVFNSISENSYFVSKDLFLGDNNYHTKTLGLGWIYSLDELHYTTRLCPDLTHVSKRTILSCISQIYDPLGLLAPAIIIVKIMLQRMWLLKLSWDDQVPNDVLSNWQCFLSKLQYLQQIRIPRYVLGNNLTHTDLHIFTDASQEAYGACAYIRNYNSDESLITVHVLCAKCKVSPIKPISIPRLELCGAVLGAKLYEKIVNSLRLKFNAVYFWSDSTIVISWIKTEPKLLKTFVQNRVGKIHELTSNLPWFHVPGIQNPADLLSRGVHLDILYSSDIWWHGPTFLRERLDYSIFSREKKVYLDKLPELNSKQIPLYCSETQRAELVNIKDIPNSILTTNLHTAAADTAAAAAAVITQANVNNILNFNRFSDFNRMQRAFAYLLRFINACRHIKCKHLYVHKIEGPLSVDEINQSVIYLARLSQIESYTDIYNALKNKQPLKLPNNLAGLNIFLDEHELIRVGGRLSNSDKFCYDKKYPIILSTKHRFTILLFQYKHKELFHCGPQLLLSTIRERWWPIKGRDLANHITRKCVTCIRRAKAKTLQIQMSDLPRERIEPSYPFIRCGVDYAGPLFILNRKGRGSRLEKCYLCLFICFSTRAIHLELVTALSTEGYLLALKRFIARRGKPAEIYSDNGTNFVGAAREFHNFLNAHKNDIINFNTSNLIKFKFIPPYSPHFGGLWEAGVKSCKYHIRRVVGNANLTYEEFATMLAQIEAILNSRPMSPLSSSPDDLLPLCPSHFLIGRPLTAPATQELTSVDIRRLTRYDRIEQMRQHFWSRWSKEYISELQKRTKWQTKAESIDTNTLVLIKEENTPPLKWRLGRVIHTYPGTDGVSRVADIKTENGIIKRSYTKICPLLQIPQDLDNTLEASTKDSNPVDTLPAHKSS